MQRPLLWIITLTIVLLGSPLTIGADTIYTWTDKNGVTRFSNEPPPEGVKEYKTVESSTASSNTLQPDNKRRSSYDQMVERASKDADASREKRKKDAAAKAEQQARALEAQEDARLKADKKQLEQQIEHIKKRAVSPTFPNGMKQAQIDALKKKIETLKKGTKSPLTKTDKSGKTAEKFSNNY